MSLITEKGTGQLVGIADNFRRLHKEIRDEATKDAADSLKQVIEGKDSEIARLQTELESKSGLPDGESATDYADRVVSECIDWLNREFGFM